MGTTKTTPAKVGMKPDGYKGLGGSTCSAPSVSSNKIAKCLNYIELARTCLGSNDCVNAKNNILLAKKANPEKSCDQEIDDVCTEFNSAGEQALADADALKDTGDNAGALKAYQKVAKTFDIVQAGKDAGERMKELRSSSKR